MSITGRIRYSHSTVMIITNFKTASEANEIARIMPGPAGLN
jgi:hypothetical protein